VPPGLLVPVAVVPVGFDPVVLVPIAPLPEDIVLCGPESAMELPEFVDEGGVVWFPPVPVVEPPDPPVGWLVPACVPPEPAGFVLVVELESGEDKTGGVSPMGTVPVAIGRGSSPRKTRIVWTAWEVCGIQVKG